MLEVVKGLEISDVKLSAWGKKSGNSIGAVKQAQLLEAADAKTNRLMAENRSLQ